MAICFHTRKCLDCGAFPSRSPLLRLIRKKPISPVAATCVPAQSSFAVAPATDDPNRIRRSYFQQKGLPPRGAAPRRGSLFSAVTGKFSRIFRLTCSSRRRLCLRRKGAKVSKIKTQPVGGNQRTGLADMLAQELFQGPGAADGSPYGCGRSPRRPRAIYPGPVTPPYPGPREPLLPAPHEQSALPG